MQGAFRVAAMMLAIAGAWASEPGQPGPAAPALEPAKVVGWPGGTHPRAPAGFRVSAFSRGFDDPRGLAVLPNGDVLVAEAHVDRVTLLRDADRDGVAEQRFALIEGLDRPSGMLLRRDRLYVAGADAVWSFSFLVGQTRVNAPPRRLFDLPAGGRDGRTYSLAMDPDEQRLYVAVATRGVTEGTQGGRDAMQAAILSARWDGSDVGVFAPGLRSTTGLAFEPVRGALWAVVDQRETPGEVPVPDSLVEVGQGDGPALGTGVAPAGLAFYRGRAFPARYHGGAFVALQGAWDGSRPAGCGVAFVPFEAGRPAGPAEEFLTGFFGDETAREVHGRPAGLAVARDGALLVADEAGDTLWRIAPD